MGKTSYINKTTHTQIIILTWRITYCSVKQTMWDGYFLSLGLSSLVYITKGYVLYRCQNVERKKYINNHHKSKKKEEWDYHFWTLKMNFPTLTVYINISLSTVLRLHFSLFLSPFDCQEVVNHIKSGQSLRLSELLLLFEILSWFYNLKICREMLR